MPHTINQECVGCVLCVHYCPVEAIRGEKKKLHIIDPVICIDCGVCGRVCAFNAVEDGLGNLVAREKPAEWARPVFNYLICVACNLCNMICPTGVLGAQHPDGHKTKDIFPYLQDSKGCIGCSFCERICPTGAIEMLRMVKKLSIDLLK